MNVIVRAAQCVARSHAAREAATAATQPARFPRQLRIQHR